LITDSCCDVSPEVLAALDVEVLPFPFELEGEPYLDDGVSLAATDLYAAMRGGASPTTAQVRIADYQRAFESAATAAEPTVFLSFSSALSGTYETALTVRDRTLEQHPGAEIHVVDSRRASIAQGLLVLEAAARRDQGLSATELVEWVESVRDRVRGYFTLESLEHLRRGGRISDAVAFAGAMLDVRPVLRFSDVGGLVIDRPVRGRKKSLRALVDLWAAEGDGRTLVIGHADSLDDADSLETILLEALPAEKVVRLNVGPVIGSHTGPGMVAVSFMVREGV
jgi:DegV family protein with EDD domain